MRTLRQRDAPIDAELASAQQDLMALAILLLVMYTGWLINLGGYPIPKTGPAPVAEPWIELFYLAGWAAVGFGVLAAVCAWMGWPGAAAAALAPYVDALARVEGFPVHAESAVARAGD